MLFSMQDFRNNPEFDISGVVTTGGADGGPSPGRDLHVTVPVLTHLNESVCVRGSMMIRCTRFLQESPASK